MTETDPADNARAIREAYEHKNRLTPSTDQLMRLEKIYGWKTQKATLNALYTSFDLPRHRDAQNTLHVTH